MRLSTSSHNRTLKPTGQGKPVRNAPLGAKTCLDVVNTYSCGAKTFTDSWLSALSTRLGCDRKVSGNYKEGNLGSWAADNADSTFKSRRWANP